MIKAISTALADLSTSKNPIEGNHEKNCPKMGKIEVKREDFRLSNVQKKEKTFDLPQILLQMFMEKHQTDFQ